MKSYTEVPGLTDEDTQISHANGTLETTGPAQWTLLLAVHANQKNPMGGPNDPIIAGYSRYSGATIPSPFFV